MTRGALVVLALVACAPPLALAEDGAAPPATTGQQPRELTAITVTESKLEQPQDKATQSARVLDQDQIEQRPINQRNITELLRYEPGVFVSPLSRNDANWGSYGGLGPKYNGYLLDGLPIDSFVDGLSLDPWAFERVESQRGPAAVMYGNYLSADFAGQQSPLAGVTNFVLRERAELPSTRLSFGAGSYYTLEGRAYHQSHAGRLHYFFGASYEKSNYTNYGTKDSWLHILRDPDYLRLKAYAKATYFIGRDDHKVSLFAHHTTHLGNAGRRNRDFQHAYDTINGVYANQLRPWLHAQLKAGLRFYDRRWAEDYYGQTDAQKQPLPNQLALREHDGVRQTIAPVDLTFNARHLGRGLLTFGADGQFARYRTYAEPNGERTTQNKAWALSTGVFAQESVSLWKLVLRAGGRFNYLRNDYDRISGGAPGLSSQSWNRLLWSAGVRYNALERLAFYANAGSSFTPPAPKSVAGTLLASDAGVVGRNGQLPNADLRPESGIGVDLGAELRLLAALTLGVRGFANLVDDAIVENAVSTEPSQSRSVNAGEARSLGVELTGDYELSQRFSCFANFTYTNSRVSNGVDPGQDGSNIPFVPDVLANAGVTWRLPWRLTFSPFLNAVGSFYDSTSKQGRASFGPFVVPSLRLEKTFVASGYDVDLTVVLNNLANQKYALPWQFRDPGFNGMAFLQLRM